MKFDQDKTAPSLVPIEVQQRLMFDKLDVSPLYMKHVYLGCLRQYEPFGLMTDVLWHLQMGQFSGAMSILQLGKVLAFGAKKYAAWNWLTVSEERYWEAARRHLLQHTSGELFDSESGLPHLAHAACSLMFVWCLRNHVTKPVED